jgi:hypothetical protein
MTNDLSIFLSVNTCKNSDLRNELLKVFESAGMTVCSSNYSFDNEAEFKSSTTQLICSSACSVHILEQCYGDILQGDQENSAARYQFFEAKKKLAQNSDFKLFVWYTSGMSYEDTEPAQKLFINEVRNTITNNIIFTTADSCIQLTEDIRWAMVKKDIQTYDVRATDIFFIANELDENEASEISFQLNKIYHTEQLLIVQDSAIDYLELSIQQIKKSKLTVVYFKKSGEWANSFTNQIWKGSGGVLSHTPILLIGDKNSEPDRGKKIEAPNVISLFASGPSVPVEIKNQYIKMAIS